MSNPHCFIDFNLLNELTKSYSDEEIAIKLGKSRITITSARKKFKIQSFTERTGLKKQDGCVIFGGRKKQILFNEKYFSEINSEDSAYFLGLLAADGSISNSNNKLEITLAEPDYHILNTFISCINGVECKIKKRIRPDRSKTFYRLTLCSKQMVSDLNLLGLTPSKTHTFSITKSIPNEFLPHFLRGLWDGDGSIGEKHFCVGIASFDFKEQVINFINDLGGEPPNVCVRKLRSGKNFYNISVASKRHFKFRNSLYKDATIYLNRKYEKYREFWL